jgi:hypothetical protein
MNKLAIALSLFAAIPSTAAVVSYTDYATWASAAAAPIHAITFNVANPGGPYSSGLLIDGVLFEGISAGPGNGYLYENNFGYCAVSGCLVGPPTEAGLLGATDGYLRTTLSGPTTAIAFDAGPYTTLGDLPVFRFSNGDSFLGLAFTSAPNFFGFISDTPFTFVDYHVSAGSDNGDFTVLDTVYVPAPEPQTCLLVAGGLALAALRSRKTWR